MLALMAPGASIAQFVVRELNQFKYDSICETR